MPPDSDVHLMNALIANFAVAIVPEVVPIVMHIEPRLFAVDVDEELVIRRWPLPQLPVDVRWHRPRFTVTDRATVAVFVDVATRFDDFADEAVVDQFHIARQRGIGPVL